MHGRRFACRSINTGGTETLACASPRDPGRALQLLLLPHPPPLLLLLLLLLPLLQLPPLLKLLRLLPLVLFRAARVRRGFVRRPRRGRRSTPFVFVVVAPHPQGRRGHGRGRHRRPRTHGARCGSARSHPRARVCF